MKRLAAIAVSLLVSLIVVGTYFVTAAVLRYIPDDPLCEDGAVIDSWYGYVCREDLPCTHPASTKLCADQPIEEDEGDYPKHPGE